MFEFLKFGSKPGNLNVKQPRFSDWLPYRAYDKKSRLFVNKTETGNSSIGFLLECSPMLGADEHCVNVIGQMLSEGYCREMVVAVHTWLSPSIGDRLNKWHVPRFVAGGIHHEMARHRVNHIAKGAWDSIDPNVPFIARNFRIFISGELPGKFAKNYAKLKDLRESIKSSLESLKIHSEELDPLGLIELVDEIVNLSTSQERERLEYNPHDPIAMQAVRKDVVVKQEPDRIVIRTPKSLKPGNDAPVKPTKADLFEHFDVRTFGVKSFPRKWAMWDCSFLVGDPFRDLMPPCPMMVTLAFRVLDHERESGTAKLKHMRKQTQLESVMGKWQRGLVNQVKEYEDYSDSLAQGENPVQMFYGVTTFSQWGHGNRDEAALHGLYSGQGWGLHKLERLPMHGFLASLPLTLGSGVMEALYRNGLTTKRPSASVANLLPLQGDYCGGTLAHMLLLGDKGQVFFWSPFENSGNHNVRITGKSGSGKSVGLQELVAAMVGAGVHVTLVDDGRSFRNSGKLQNANIVEFTMASGFSLNVFRMIDAEMIKVDGDYRLECFSLLKSIIGQMARFKDELNDEERGLIDDAVNVIWNEHGNDATVDDIIAHLNRDDSTVAAKSLATSMTSFSASGTYGQLFLGEPSFKLEEQFTIFELSDLSGHDELKAVVMTAIMFLSTQVMRNGDRAVRKMFAIDEAWSMLTGGQMAEFVQSYARTCRKYGASLVTATQSIFDYYKSSGAQAALENSDWAISFEQLPTTINNAIEKKLITVTPYQERLLRGTKRKGTIYSGLIIEGPDSVYFRGRLVLDPFSAIIFSSTAEVYAHIEKLEAEGFELIDIINHMAFGEPLSFQPKGPVLLPDRSNDPDLYDEDLEDDSGSHADEIAAE